MGQSKAQKQAIVERRRNVASLLLRQTQKQQIAALVGVTLDTITADTHWLEAKWRAELIDDPVALKAKEWAEIEEAESECWENYSASRDPRWLTELRGWKERKAKLLGLDCPLKIDQRSINFTIEFDTPGQPGEESSNLPCAYPMGIKDERRCLDGT